MSDVCAHETTLPLPESAATVCERCGQVFVCGKPWGYKSGHLMEWVRDLSEAAKAAGGGRCVGATSADMTLGILVMSG